MLLKYTFPKERYSYKELDKLTFHKSDQWTWNTGGLLFLARKGFEIVSIENFDYKQFVEFGEEYLKMIWTEEVFEAQKKYSDFPQERKRAKKFLSEGSIRHIRRPTTLSEIEEYFRKGFVVLVTINSLALEKEKGYVSHIVILTDIDKKTVTFHDPGLPPQEGRVASRRDFEKALYSPYREIASLIAVRHENFKE